MPAKAKGDLHRADTAPEDGAALEGGDWLYEVFLNETRTAIALTTRCAGNHKSRSGNASVWTARSRQRSPADLSGDAAMQLAFELIERTRSRWDAVEEWEADAEPPGRFATAGHEGS